MSVHKLLQRTIIDTIIFGLESIAIRYHEVALDMRRRPLKWNVILMGSYTSEYVDKFISIEVVKCSHHMCGSLIFLQDSYLHIGPPGNPEWSSVHADI